MTAGGLFVLKFRAYPQIGGARGEDEEKAFFAQGVYSYGTRPEQKNGFDEVFARETLVSG
jgi:hypothetical protein